MLTIVMKFGIVAIQNAFFLSWFPALPMIWHNHSPNITSFSPHLWTCPLSKFGLAHVSRTKPAVRHLVQNSDSWIFKFKFEKLGTWSFKEKQLGTSFHSFATENVLQWRRHYDFTLLYIFSVFSSNTCA